MENFPFLVSPLSAPPLDASFRPAALANRAFRQALGGQGAPLVLSLEREDGKVSRFETRIFPEGHPYESANAVYVERLFKFLLWQRGGFRAYVGGAPKAAAMLQRAYAPGGARHFDHRFMGQQVYERPFEIVACTLDAAPPASESGAPPEVNVGGCRIGFDLGASDRKVSALLDGQVVYSEEVNWEPGKHADPAYHYHEIMAALRTAASKLPRVDAIGGSSAGIYINDRPMVSSLFRSVPSERFDEVKGLFQRIRDELNVPLRVINDGDVTAMAGAMSLGDTGILGLALGSSLAAGYVDCAGNVLGWLNELAFAPIDYSPAAVTDAWSGDMGCGASSLSQQAVFRMAPQAGIELPAHASDAEKLVAAQQELEKGHEGAVRIWQTMGACMGYALAHYADFYGFKHVIILGRCTSGSGGSLILEGANRVIENEFPELAARVDIQLPDEKNRRVGQSIAAASLPNL